MAASFDKAFQNLTGNSPYPWQQRLFTVLAQGDVPDGLDIPTGLGKTSVIPIWLLAHLLPTAPINRPPMRLVYVVNRRTIVDQATTIAEGLWGSVADNPALNAIWDARFKGEALAVSTLRGAKADNGDWLLTPHVPAIIVGTVDMIGSRLLFNGYRTGRWQRSRHAGLLGQDTLIVHDEKHLSEPFQKLIDWIVKRQRQDSRRLRVMPMSATIASNGGDILQIDDHDRRIAQDKLRAVKSVYLHASGNDVAAQLAKLATQQHAAPGRIIVFVRSPQTARAVREKLLSKAHGIDKSSVEMLTGTLRGHERDELVRKPVFRHLVQGWERSEPRREYLIATSAGEVGADFDADHIVCDLSTIDAMIQRFGRVNRRGGPGRDARIDVVLDKPNARTNKDGSPKGAIPIDIAQCACGQFLETLKAEHGDGFDASPDAVSKWRDRAGYREACQPPVPTVEPHDVTLDAWSLTSIQDDWPLAHDVEPYLHGLDDPMPQTTVAWRAELDEFVNPDEGDIDPSPFRQILDAYPLRPQELLQNKPEQVAELLRGAKDRCGTKPAVVLKGRTVEVRRLAELVGDDRGFQQIRSCTIILPASAGGLDLEAGMVAADVATPATDVADQQETARARVLLVRDEEGQWHARKLPPAGELPAAAPDHGFPKWTMARDVIAKELGMRCVACIQLATDDEDIPTRRLLLFHEHRQKQKEGERLLVQTHHEDVLKAAGERVRTLGLQQDSPEAKALLFAAAHHDSGKAWESGDGCWQRAIGNGNRATSFAKSLGQGMNYRQLAGYRHEFGSLCGAVCCNALLSFDPPTQDLALHLIGTHHGRGRPGFSAEATRALISNLPELLQPAEVARRFDRLQRRYGHWGLAWLESILISADAAASQDRDAPDKEDEEAIEEAKP